MKNNAFIKVWNIIYPIFIYYVISNIVMSLAVLALGISSENYSQHYTMLQTIATAVSLPFLYGFYRKDQMMFTVFHQRTANARQEIPKSKQRLHGALALICGILAGLVLNNVIGATGLLELSRGYQSVTAQFYAGDLIFEILGVGILIPLVEELLYRGIVYARLSDWIGIPAAALVSALVFGGLHMNIVQFIYAFLMGLLLVYLLEQTHNLYGAVLGHMGANLVTVLRTETGFLDWMSKNAAVYWTATVVMTAVCAGIIWFLRKRNRA